MSNIGIYYFSGTGNTAFAVKKIAKKLELLGNRVTVISCETCEKIDVDFDILGIAFPIHSSYAPKIFSSFLDKLPKVNDKPFFGIVTSGYMAGDILCFEGKRLEEKGYIPFLYRNIVVGNNLNLPMLCPLKVTKKEKIDKKLNYIDKYVNDIAMKINNQTRDLRGNGLVGLSFGSIQRSVGKLHEKINFKGFTADENCTKCLWCVKNCPINNIVLKDNKILFEDRCILCMRCYNFCPKRAIQMTNRTKKKKYSRYKGPEGLGIRTKFNSKM